MDRVAIVDTYYWWLADHHEGLGSDKYARLCKVSKYYTPGRLAKSPGDDPEGYDALCEREGCTHV